VAEAKTEMPVLISQDWTNATEGGVGGPQDSFFNLRGCKELIERMLHLGLFVWSRKFVSRSEIVEYTYSSPLQIQSLRFTFFLPRYKLTSASRETRV